MFDHLDDPSPPSYDPDAVRQRIRIIRRRRHRRALSAGTVMTAAAFIAALAIVDVSHPTAVVVGPSGHQPVCAPPASDRPDITVYDHASLHVGWLPSGYHQVSGVASPPNNNRPLTYAPGGAKPAESVEVIFDVGISAQRLPPPAGTGAVQIATVDIGGNTAGVYDFPAQVGVNWLEWSPGFDMAVELRGANIALPTLEQIARSITTSLGPSTVITSGSYLGPVIPYRTVTANPVVVHAFPQLFANGNLAYKLATYAEVRIAIGANETGGTDAADGTPVWLIYNQIPAGSHSTPTWYAIVNAVTGNPIEGGAEEQIDGKASPASVAWIGQIPDHQTIAPCTEANPASQSTADEPPTVYGTAPSGTVGEEAFNRVVAVSTSTGDIERTVAGPSQPLTFGAGTDAFGTLVLAPHASKLYMAVFAGMCPTKLGGVSTGGGQVTLIRLPPGASGIHGLAVSPDATMMAFSTAPCPAAGDPTGQTTTFVVDLLTGSSHPIPTPNSDSEVTSWGGVYGDQLLFSRPDGAVTIVTLHANQTVAASRTLQPPDEGCQLENPTFVGETALVAVVEQCHNSTIGSGGSQLIEIDPATGNLASRLVALDSTVDINDYAIDASGTWIIYQTVARLDNQTIARLNILHQGSTTTLNAPSGFTSLAW